MDASCEVCELDFRNVMRLKSHLEVLMMGKSFIWRYLKNLVVMGWIVSGLAWLSSWVMTFFPWWIGVLMAVVFAIFVVALFATLTEAPE